MTTLVAIVIVSGAAILAAGVTAMVYRRRPDRISDRVDADRVARVEAQLRRSTAERVESRRPRALDAPPEMAVAVGRMAPAFHPDPAQPGTAGTAEWLDGQRVRVDRD